MVWLLDSVIPVVLSSLEACLRELTQIVWGKKGTQMHQCWELLQVCAGQSRELLLYAIGGIREGILVQKSRDSLVRVTGTV